MFSGFFYLSIHCPSIQLLIYSINSSIHIPINPQSTRLPSILKSTNPSIQWSIHLSFHQFIHPFIYRISLNIAEYICFKIASRKAFIMRKFRLFCEPKRENKFSVRINVDITRPNVYYCISLCRIPNSRMDSNDE